MSHNYQIMIMVKTDGMDSLSDISKAMGDLENVLPAILRPYVYTLKTPKVRGYARVSPTKASPRDLLIKPTKIHPPKLFFSDSLEEFVTKYKVKITPVLEKFGNLTLIKKWSASVRAIASDGWRNITRTEDPQVEARTPALAVQALKSLIDERKKKWKTARKKMLAPRRTRKSSRKS